MSLALRQPPLLSPEEYLAGEAISDVKHEYLGGIVHAMAGGTNRHNIISANVLAALHGRLRGKKCRPFNSDTLLRIDRGDDLRFYYPDVMIVCQQNGPLETFQDHPTVIFEVRSDSTARFDQGEKRQAYLTIPSLEAYVLVDDTQVAVTVWRRQGEGWESEYYTSSALSVCFESADCELPLADIYDGVKQ